MGTKAIAAELGLGSNSTVIGMARRLGLGDKPPAKSARSAEAKEEAIKRKREREKQNRINKTEADKLAGIVKEPRKRAAPAGPTNEDGSPRVSIPGEVQAGYKPKAEVFDEGFKTTLDLGHGDCKWPIGAPGTPEFMHCGRKKPIGPDIPYCAEHAHVAYMPLPPKKGDVKPLKQWFGGQR